MKSFCPARRRIDVSVGESVRILRELQGYSQNELAKLTGIPQATLSAIENDRVRLGVERAKILARAYNVIRQCWFSQDGKSLKERRPNVAFHRLAALLRFGRN